MIMTVHAGHNADGYAGSGAVGFIKESTCAREIVRHLMERLSDIGMTVGDITVSGNSYDKSTVLSTLIERANGISNADLHLSIHLNAGAGMKKKDGKTTGVEALIYPGSKSRTYAQKLCSALEKELGLTNRGVKERKDLAFLKKTKAPAIILECLFVDDEDDAALFDAKRIATAIANVFGKPIPKPNMTYSDFVLMYGKHTDDMVGTVAKTAGGIYYFIPSDTP